MKLKSSKVITMNKKRYIVVNHMNGKYDYESLVLTPGEYNSGLSRGIKWKMHKKKLLEVM